MPQGYKQTIDNIIEEKHKSTRNHSITWKIKYYSIIDYIIGGHLAQQSDEFVNLNQKVSARIFGCDNHTMAQLLRILVEAGLLLSDRKMSIAAFRFEQGKKIFTKEGKSYGFKIPQYNEQIIEGVGVLVPTSNLERNKTNKSKIISKDSDLKLYNQCLKNIRIDTKKLNEIINEVLTNKTIKIIRQSQYHNYITNYIKSNTNYYIKHTIPYEGVLVPEQNGSTIPVPTHNQGTKMPTPIETDDKTIARIMRAVGIINSGTMTATRPVKDSRVYCELTNMNRELRSCIRIDGEPIIGLDIRNSQPLIASYLFKRYYTENALAIPDDVLQYQQDCEQGIFYDDFMKEIKLPNEFRTEFKKDFFRQVFFSMLVDKTNPLKEMFIKKYPSVWEVIIEEKGGYNFCRDYNKFAQRLQCVEALLMFDIVNIGLLKKDIKSYNNFDSLYVNNMEDYETAKQLTMEAFNSIGINPTINPEIYNDETSDNEVLDTQIPDQTNKEYKCQATETQHENGLPEQQLEENLPKPLPYWFLTHKEYINGWGKRVGEEKWNTQLDKLKQMGYDLEQYGV